MSLKKCDQVKQIPKDNVYTVINIAVIVVAIYTGELYKHYIALTLYHYM